MSSYIALLRGINVSGKNILAMSRLRAMVEGLGYTGVQTYIQTGNILLTASAKEDRVRQDISEVLENELGSPVPVLIRSELELARIVSRNPFLIEDPSADISQLHVTLFDGSPTTAALESLKGIVPIPSTPIASRSDRFQLAGNAIYLRCFGGYGNTRLTNTIIERTLGVRATTRNWRTMIALHSLASNRL